MTAMISMTVGAGCFTGSMPCLSPATVYIPVAALRSLSLPQCKKMWWKTSSGRLERHIPKANIDLPSLTIVILIMILTVLLTVILLTSNSTNSKANCNYAVILTVVLTVRLAVIITVILTIVLTVLLTAMISLFPSSLSNITVQCLHEVIS